MKIIQVKTNNTFLKSDRTIKFRLLNSYLTAGNSNWWPRVIKSMAPGGLGLTVYRWLRKWAWRQLWRKRWRSSKCPVYQPWDTLSIGDNATANDCRSDDDSLAHSIRVAVRPDQWCVLYICIFFLFLCAIAITVKFVIFIMHVCCLSLIKHQYQY